VKLHKYRDIDLGYMKDYVYEVLRRNIMELYLKPGALLKKELIARELNVSSTPVRDAFAKLLEEGLVVIYPQRGTYVSFINLERVEQAKFMREHLEKAIIEEACDNLPKEYLYKLQTNLKMQEIFAEEENYIKLFEFDNKFHEILFNGCNKGEVWSLIQQFSSHVSRLRILSLAANFNRREVINDHKNIVNALKHNEKDNAKEVITAHIERISFDSEKLLSEYSEYFEEMQVSK